MGSAGATCEHMLVSKPRDIDAVHWDDERFGQLCITPDAYADIKAELEALCSLSKECVYETSPSLDKLYRKAVKARQ